MNVAGPELLIILVLMLSVVVPIVTIIDVASKPDWAFEAANVNRMLFIVLAALGILFCGIGLVVGIVWVLGFRPKVVAAAGRTPPAPPPPPSG